MQLKVGMIFYDENTLGITTKRGWQHEILAIHGNYVFVETRIKRKDHGNKMQVDCSCYWISDFLRQTKFCGVMNIKYKGAKNVT